ncbi:MAG: hypothetical protein U5J83_12745 [Bryobacterales bacterium]|nr:hypothetical protein [Bryobacterales bacterium]
MSTRYRTFDRMRLEIKPLAEREHDLEISQWPQLADAAARQLTPELPKWPGTSRASSKEAGRGS